MSESRISVTVRMEQKVRDLADAVAAAQTRDGSVIVTRGDVFTKAIQAYAKKVRIV